MDDELQIVTVSELTQHQDIPECPPLTEEVLDQIVKTMRKGLVLHRILQIKPNERPLLVHVHPETLLSLVQEVRRLRLVAERYNEVVQALGYELEDLAAGKIKHEDVVEYAKACDTKELGDD